MNYPELKIASILFMLVLSVWAVVWIYVSAQKLYKKSGRKLYWQTHLIWSLINLAIALYSLISTWQIDDFTEERAYSLLTIVSVNVVLDIVYVIVGYLLHSSKHNGRKEIGRAVIIQGLFLLVLDIIIVTTFLLVMGLYYSE